MSHDLRTSDIIYQEPTRSKNQIQSGWRHPSLRLLGGIVLVAACSTAAPSPTASPAPAASVAPSPSPDPAPTASQIPPPPTQTPTPTPVITPTSPRQPGAGCPGARRNPATAGGVPHSALGPRRAHGVLDRAAGSLPYRRPA